ncbi:dTDP-4-dehydrorhamnose reductase [Rathayibacter toxicus]|uniref:dTDP-4-dehydrorhamnose reductase n=1 Tax=Rathayibacter toxicus TaxID=145458 RepID=A0A0C5BCY5_9MICO|nr:dTDP-4-dehydrorhamnose reductase [Rathayibacter toxicus]AJM76869.1 hypothetical protein TI83_00540 [Rathayibacter toxicus]ALS57365.1 hypothetical protein APU90_05940 [Rathayibacter toxicus]KKM45669.1 hypothetical protein VT73_05765 [Rathayibacter toxicus]PPG24757.1 dTDP-4-dehydrorhamnose reductase [Rathayibacter toxicus]PPG48211.1 dTDP-4-dehydrorhamnose reductase [Rathayibacter toxicus]
MRWTILGGHGMLGDDLSSVLQQRGHIVRSLSSSDCDVRSPAQLAVRLAGSDVIVNAAAWTAVDLAESRESEAFAVNSLGPYNVARAAMEAGARLVHISTDYVFSGDATVPYEIDSPLNPQSAYGRTKAAGEWAVQSIDGSALIVRTAWLYGAAGDNFIEKILRSAASGQLRVVTDQVGQPTWTRDLADYIVGLIELKRSGGIYHGTNSGSVSRFDFVHRLMEMLHLTHVNIDPCRSADFVLPAERPGYSVLQHRNGIETMPPWEDALGRYLDER